MRSPKQLNKKSALIFQRLIKIIDTNEKNIDSVSILADLLHRYEECQRSLDEDGLIITSPTGQTRANPITSYQSKIIPQIRSLFSDLGMYTRTDTGGRDPISDFLS